ncbi:hypothetical protein ACFV2U_31405, partial [Streptomyces sp. NPDC059697]
MSGACGHPVLVVGAGPVGLSAALALRAHGLPVVGRGAGPPVAGTPGRPPRFVPTGNRRRLDG